MKNNYKNLKVLILYTFFTLAYFFPVIISPKRALIGFLGDQTGMLWFSWWKNFAFNNGLNFQFSHLWHAPFGATVYSYPNEPLLFGVNFLGTFFINEVAFYNLMMVISFIFSGIFMYFLVKIIVGDFLISFMAGLAFSFSPYHIIHATNHVGLAQIWLIPVFFLSLINLDEKKTVKAGIVSALAFVITLLISNYYGYLMLFSFVFYFAAQTLIHHSEWRFYIKSVLKSLVVFGVLSFFSSIVFLLPFLVNRFLKPTGGLDITLGSRYSYSDLFTFSARPWHYILPSIDHPVLGGFTKAILARVGNILPKYLTANYFPQEQTVFVGFTIILLAAIAFYKLKEKKWVVTFFLIGLLSAVFSAPPYVVLGKVKIFFPAHFLFSLFPMFRSYARFASLVLMSVIILAALGLNYIIISKKIAGFKKVSLTLVVFILVLFEFFVPLKYRKLEVPQVYKYLAKQKDTFTILEYPYEFTQESLFWQRVYKKGLLNPRNYKTEDFDSEKFTTRLTKTPENMQKLKEWQVKYLIFHKQASQENNEAEQFFRQQKDLSIEKELDGVIVFKIFEK